MDNLIHLQQQQQTLTEHPLNQLLQVQQLHLVEVVVILLLTLLVLLIIEHTHLMPPAILLWMAQLLVMYLY